MHVLETFLQELTESQEGAVRWDKGALLVLAGPGSGKTRVLTCRIGRLLDESRGQRFRILALTFTNKAAHEMAQRVTQLVPGLEDRAVIDTFHGFCAQVLRQHGVHVGVKTNFAVFSDKADRQAVLEDALRREAQRYARDASRLLSYIDSLKARLVRPAEAESELTKYPGIGPEDARRISHAYRNYEGELQRANALDFSSLLIKVYELFGYPAMVRHYQQVYRFWHIDEFQDTNNAQYQLLRRMAGREFREIFAVADDDQIIYEWNGASVSRIEEFRRDFCSTTKFLPTNFRCPARIVEVANHLVSKNCRRVAAKPDSKAARQKTTRQARTIQCQRFNTDDAEARGIAAEIAQMDRIAREQTAILARNRYLLERVLDALQQCRVPAAVLKRRDDFLTPEMRWLVACLDQFTRPRNLRSFRTVVMSFNELAEVALDLEQLVSLAEAKQATCFSLWMENIRNANMQSPAAQYVEIIEELWERRLKPVAAVQQITHEFNRDRSNHDLQTDLKAWRQLTNRFRFRNGNRSLNRFMQQLQIHSKEPDVSHGTVRLATIHGAKGLEFDDIYLIGMAEEVLPSWQSIRRGDQSAALEEERRSCFVAITRTRRNLHLSWADKYSGRQKQPSRFLGEMFGTDNFGHIQCPD